MYTARLALVLLLICSLARMAAADIPPDPALAKPVTLALKGEGLVGILAMLEKQTGVRLKALGKVADRDVTIFVDQKPLSEIMDGLVTVFGYKWTRRIVNGHSEYEFGETPQAASATEAAWQSAVATAWNELDATLKSRAALKPDASAVQAEMDRLRPMAEDQRGMYIEWEGLRRKRDTPVAAALYGDLAAARLYCDLSKEAMAALRSGSQLRFDSQSPDPAWKIPADVLEYLPQYVKAYEWAQPRISHPAAPATEWPPAWDQYAITLRSDVSENALDLWLVVLPRKNGDKTQNGPMYGQAISSSPPRIPADYVPDMKRKFNDQTMLQNVTVTSAEIAAEANTAPWAFRGICYANRADMLALLHQKMGLPIIADYLTGYQWRDNGNLIGTHLLQEAMDFFVQPDAYWGWDGRYLLSRAANPRYGEQQAIPRRMLKAWQAEYAKQGYLGLDSLGELAQLSREQRAPLQNAARFLGLESIDYLGGWQGFGDPYLKLYGLLSSEQRKAALGTGTPVAQFTSEQSLFLKSLLGERPGGLDWRAYTAFGRTGKVITGIYDKRWTRVDRPDDPGDTESAGGAVQDLKPVSLQIAKEPGETQYVMFLPVSSPWPQRPQPLWNVTKREDIAKRLAADPRAKTATVKEIRSEVYRFVVTLKSGGKIESTVSVTTAPVVVSGDESTAPIATQLESKPPSPFESGPRSRFPGEPASPRPRQ